MKARNINFRQTHSERSGEKSYKNFARYFLKIRRILKEERPAAKPKS